MHWDQENVKLITVPEYLDMFPKLQVAQPSMSSWGHKGYAEVWLEGSNDWVYRHLHEDAERMVELALHNPDPGSPLRLRALNQAARELLLAQSSDWAFIMKTGTTVPYATKRTSDHVKRFTRIHDALVGGGEVDEGWLAEIEKRDNLFPAIDYSVYAS
jgi:1,4-alpha-glucan branching enzyme